MPVNNVDLLESSGNHGRLSRWFSIRRGSAHHYDVDSSDTVSLTSPVKTSQMPQLCEVSPRAIADRSRIVIVDQARSNSLSCLLRRRLRASRHVSDRRGEQRDGAVSVHAATKTSAAHASVATAELISSAAET